MSSMYSLEPPTQGKVLMKTTLGDIDIEFWPKEAPMACRNFVQLCMEGYYDNTIFHRIVKGFMAQGGDPSGSGLEGESIYGRPFKTEVHSRLKFSHRGILAMATPPGKTDCNASQFFLTFDACEWLNGKATIFGKVTGDTVFNLLRMEECEIDPDTDRPEHPPRLLSVEILAPPFDDIIPRKPVQSVQAPVVKKISKKKRKQATVLLSFGDEVENESPVAHRPMISSHDVLDDDPNIVPSSSVQSIDAVEAPRKSRTRPPPVPAIAPQFEEEVVVEEKVNQELVDLRAKYEAMRGRAVHVDRQKPSLAGDGSAGSLMTPLEQRRLVYLKRKQSNRREREEMTLKKVASFQHTLAKVSAAKQVPQVETDDVDESGTGWMLNQLAFSMRPQDFDPMARDVSSYEYTLTDPLALNQNRPSKQADGKRH